MNRCFLHRAALAVVLCVGAFGACSVDPLENDFQELDGGLAADQDVSPSADDGATPGGAAAEPESEATVVSTTAMDAWPITLPVVAIEDVRFHGERLWVAGREPGGAVLFEIARSSGGVPTVLETLKIPDDEGSGGQARATWVTTAAGVRALWLRDGQLMLGGVGAGVAARALASEEGGQFEGPLVAADAFGGDGFVACLGDAAGPRCLRFDAAAEVTGVFPLKGWKTQDVAWLGAVREGFLLVLGACKRSGEIGCTREGLTAVPLSASGAPQRGRSLVTVDALADSSFIGGAGGVHLIARRGGGKLPSAWWVTARGVREISGDFGRVVGGISEGEGVTLIERAHLRMRQGFPVRGFELRPLAETSGKNRAKAGKRRGKREGRLRFPEVVEAVLPRAVDQTFVARGEAVAFVEPPKAGAVHAVVIRVGEGAPGQEP